MRWFRKVRREKLRSKQFRFRFSESCALGAARRESLKSKNFPRARERQAVRDRSAFTLCDQSRLLSLTRCRSFEVIVSRYATFNRYESRNLFCPRAAHL